jgi:hypothetical protein
MKIWNGLIGKQESAFVLLVGVHYCSRRIKCGDPNNKEGSKVCVELEDDCCFVSGKGRVIAAEQEWKMMPPTRRVP